MRCMEYVQYSEQVIIVNKSTLKGFDDPLAVHYPLITRLLTKEISSVTQNIILYMILLI